MKNDSKERLEKQLNDNPELKERFVMQMSDIRDITEATRLKFKPIAESLKATTAPLEGLADSLKGLANLSSPFADIMDSLKGAPSPFADIMGSLPTFEPSQSIAKSMELFNMNVKPILDSLPTLEDLEEAALLLNKIKKEYALLRSSEAEFIEHERLFVPKDELGVYEFVDWYLYCYLFDKPFDARKDEELTLYHFNLFHTFKQRYITQKKWSVEDERKSIKELESSDSENKENVSDEDKPKITAKHHALAYIFDCDAKGQKTKVGRKKELEQIGRARSDNKIDGNTFYKAFNEVMQVDRNKERDLTYIAGEDWRNIIIRLSKDADKLDKYLKTKDL